MKRNKKHAGWSGKSAYSFEQKQSAMV